VSQSSAQPVAGSGRHVARSTRTTTRRPDERWSPRIVHTGHGDFVEDDGIQARAAADAATTRRLIQEHQGAPAPVRPVAVHALLLLGFWLTISGAVLKYPPYGELAQDAALRDLVIGALLIIGGLWLRQFGQSRLVAVLCGLGGGLLVLFGAFLSHQSAQAPVNEVVCGLLVVMAAALTAVGDAPASSTAPHGD
jgi:hypothetical protein